MTFISRRFVRCVLCQGALPSTKNDVVEAHFEDQHRAYFNIDFLFKSSLLDNRIIEITKIMDFMVSLIPSKNGGKEPSENENIFRNDQYSKIVEVPFNEQIDSQNDRSIDRFLNIHKEPSINETIFHSKIVETSSNEHNNGENKTSSIDRFPVTLFDPSTNRDKELSAKDTILQNDLQSAFKSTFDKNWIENYSENESSIDSFSIKLYEPMVDLDMNISNAIDSFPIAKLERSPNEVGAFHCLLCNRKYPSEKKLREHKIVSHDIRARTCSICNKHVLGNKRLNNHMKNHKKVNCEDCNKVMPISNLKRHLKSCKKEKLWLICKFCNFKTVQRTEFKKHLKMHKHITNEFEEKIFKCQLCDYETKDSSNIRRHKIVHSIKHLCTFCTLKFNSEITLNRHISHAHMEEKDVKIRLKPTIFSCDKCDYKAKSKFSVTRHQSTHLKPKREKPAFLCQICEKKFNRVAKLKRHMQNCKYKDQIFVSM